MHYFTYLNHYLSSNSFIIHLWPKLNVKFYSLTLICFFLTALQCYEIPDVIIIITVWNTTPCLYSIFFLHIMSRVLSVHFSFVVQLNGVFASTLIRTLCTQCYSNLSYFTSWSMCFNIFLYLSHIYTHTILDPLYWMWSIGHSVPSYFPSLSTVVHLHVSQFSTIDNL